MDWPNEIIDRMFANEQGAKGSIPGRVIPKIK